MKYALSTAISKLRPTTGLPAAPSNGDPSSKPVSSCDRSVSARDHEYREVTPHRLVNSVVRENRHTSSACLIRRESFVGGGTIGTGDVTHKWEQRSKEAGNDQREGMGRPIRHVIGLSCTNKPYNDRV